MNFNYAANQRAKRKTELIANFIDGFADGWYMAVGEFFKAELDIKFTERVQEGKQIKTLTQGPYFSFKEGQIFYDKKDGYCSWDVALKNVNLVCKIIKASPCELSTSNHISKDKEFDEGFVEFILYKPNPYKSALEELGEYSLTQAEFVNFLKTGKLPTN